MPSTAKPSGGQAARTAQRNENAQQDRATPPAVLDALATLRKLTIQAPPTVLAAKAAPASGSSSAHAAPRASFNAAVRACLADFSTEPEDGSIRHAYLTLVCNALLTLDDGIRTAAAALGNVSAVKYEILGLRDIMTIKQTLDLVMFAGVRPFVAVRREESANVAPFLEWLLPERPDADDTLDLVIPALIQLLTSPPPRLFQTAAKLLAEKHLHWVYAGLFELHHRQPPTVTAATIRTVFLGTHAALTFRALTSLMPHAAAPWLRSACGTWLAQLTLRPHGLGAILASAGVPDPDPTQIARLARVVTRPPARVPPDAYLDRIVGELMGMVDVPDPVTAGEPVPGQGPPPLRAAALVVLRYLLTATDAASIETMRKRLLDPVFWRVAAGSEPGSCDEPHPQLAQVIAPCVPSLVACAAALEAVENKSAGDADLAQQVIAALAWFAKVDEAVVGRAVQEVATAPALPALALTVARLSALPNTATNLRAVASAVKAMATPAFTTAVTIAALENAHAALSSLHMTVSTAGLDLVRQHAQWMLALVDVLGLDEVVGTAVAHGMSSRGAAMGELFELMHVLRGDADDAEAEVRRLQGAIERMKVETEAGGGAEVKGVGTSVEEVLRKVDAEKEPALVAHALDDLARAVGDGDEVQVQDVLERALKLVDHADGFVRAAAGSVLGAVATVAPWWIVAAALVEPKWARVEYTEPDAVLLVDEAVQTAISKPSARDRISAQARAMPPSPANAARPTFPWPILRTSALAVVTVTCTALSTTATELATVLATAGTLLAANSEPADVHRGAAAVAASAATALAALPVKQVASAFQTSRSETDMTVRVLRWMAADPRPQERDEDACVHAANAWAAIVAIEDEDGLQLVDVMGW
ncbi:hypothetical protein AMAG_11666 [Allomyces macrogynus ATCC 38327]|uniref:Uncharacterized protein n=1 Tax=Allomyces macrogynus (strain ATCC 38327) TaxID=578462 RepID=A0A0L0SVQ0_ALLM3|nr:hypothetical protein AMAG_11666 [Allomyces macrogynus ATCC 38327]|eukprot:KNE66536.1 hypothetical protein AMAG_11666 [Allomyces macrogynus ATCC 38327]